MFFIPPHRQSSVPPAYLSGMLKVLKSAHQYSGSDSLMMTYKWYRYHRHITSNPATSLSESRMRLKPGNWSTFWKVRNYPQQRLSHKNPIRHFCAPFFPTQQTHCCGELSPQWHITWHDAMQWHHWHHSADFSDVESSCVLSLSLIWGSVAQRQWWHFVDICSISLTVRAVGHLWHC